MNLKKNFLIFYIFINIFLILIINFKNDKKVNVNLFTWQSKNYSLGKIVTFSYIAGITFNGLLTFLITSNENKKEIRKESEDESLKDNEEEFNYEGIDIERAPERDIKETQPTISVNYRVIENNKYSSNKINKNSKVRASDTNFYDDWGDDNKDW